MFDAASNNADLRGFAERASDDRHHFRFIVSPEDATEMADLRAFTRDLVRQMEHDLGTRLDRVGIDHWNTDNPHVHLIVRQGRAVRRFSVHARALGRCRKRRPNWRSTPAERTASRCSRTICRRRRRQRWMRS
jgi:type IV secretory pathway VirD2 relaxase